MNMSGQSTCLTLSILSLASKEAFCQCKAKDYPHQLPNTFLFLCEIST
ncbi:hypothetical protein SAMN06265222_12916 [Neorhodopirellula lusitana]|uniref:Uncharacterized protein n=1 Tax=Neorhodopirellula lusitana TaxID=445327 RepID=A0ABY1QU33_9BACT|nr:hypothetical protein SAMN06265222_12916 [Neorhodopirellula lusitana]